MNFHEENHTIQKLTKKTLPLHKYFQKNHTSKKFSAFAFFASSLSKEEKYLRQRKKVALITLSNEKNPECLFPFQIVIIRGGHMKGRFTIPVHTANHSDRI